MIELSVNIDHVATIRQARLAREPDPVWAAVEAQLGGADGITVHLREDRRHIQDGDLPRLAHAVQVKLNLEMAPTSEMVEIACGLKPQLVMLVPEGRQEITTEGGLDVLAQTKRVGEAVGRLLDAGLRVSAFVDPAPSRSRLRPTAGSRSARCTPDATRSALRDHGGQIDHPLVQEELDAIRRAGELIIGRNMQFNAGHALDYTNVQPVAALPELRELHIGHAIVSRAVLVGMRRAVKEMKRLMRDAAALGDRG